MEGRKPRVFWDTRNSEPKTPSNRWRSKLADGKFWHRWSHFPIYEYCSKLFRNKAAQTTVSLTMLWSNNRRSSIGRKFWDSVSVQRRRKPRIQSTDFIFGDCVDNSRSHLNNICLWRLHVRTVGCPWLTANNTCRLLNLLQKEYKIMRLKSDESRHSQAKKKQTVTVISTRFKQNVHRNVACCLYVGVGVGGWLTWSDTKPGTDNR